MPKRKIEEMEDHNGQENGKEKENDIHLQRWVIFFDGYNFSSDTVVEPVEFRYEWRDATGTCTKLRYCS